MAIGCLLALSACEQTAKPEAAAIEPTTPATTSSTTTAPAKRVVTETRPIPYRTTKVNDPALPAGTTKVSRRGARGVMTFTYEVALANGAETGRRLLRRTVTKAPVTRVISIGTKQARQCDPNYTGACVPIAGDVDCDGGSGNGPAYVQGPVRIVGSDIYDLDRDGDGIACDT
ncbi:G5 domain-containing protein [Spirillospora sp. NPDC047279]|uniref:G5 domain-containing protein n=1 Tax=Spirillospora sp. NPDC047279 TaxID=3155478 RepID=UPI0033CEFCCD